MSTPIDTLRAQLIIAKDQEKRDRALRLEIEQQIIAHLKDELKESGTTNIAGLKFVTGFTRKWDQVQVAELIEKGIPEKLFPFKTEYKEDKKKSDYLAANEPDVWEFIAKALTLTPRKPTISIIETKKEAA